MSLLGDLVEIRGGGTPSRKIPEYWDGGILWATVKDFKSTSLNSALEKISLAGLENSASNFIEAGSIIIPTRMAVGKAAISTVGMAINQDLKALCIKDNNKVDRDYLFRAILSKSSYLKSCSKGATVKGITLDVLRGLEIPLPPLEEQKRIAAILDKADALRRKREKAITLTDDLLRATFLDMFGDPVTNPKGWQIKAVGELTDCIVPGRDKPKSFTGDTAWITTKDLKHLRTTSKSDGAFIGLSGGEIRQVKAKVVPTNSVIMTCVGDLGVISLASAPMVINQQLHAFQCHDKLNKYFLMFVLSFQKDYMLKMASSTTVPYMNKTICNSVPVTLPPIGEQEIFASFVKKTIKKLEIDYASKQLSGDLFSSLSQCAFRGGA